MHTVFRWTMGHPSVWQGTLHQLKKKVVKKKFVSMLRVAVGVRCCKV